jgi:hypothetical protein
VLRHGQRQRLAPRDSRRCEKLFRHAPLEQPVDVLSRFVKAAPIPDEFSLARLGMPSYRTEVENLSGSEA